MNFEEPAWSLLYALGWIVERDDSRAKNCSNFCRSNGKSDAIAAAWQELKQAFVEGRIAATGRKKTFRTEVFTSNYEHMYRRAGVSPPQYAMQVVDNVGCRETIPAIEWLDSTSPAAGLRNYASVLLAKNDVLMLWPATGKATLQAKRRGPKGDKTKQIAERMISDLRVGLDLQSWKQEQLAANYGASRTTCVAALRSALSELNSDK